VSPIQTGKKRRFFSSLTGLIFLDYLARLARTALGTCWWSQNKEKKEKEKGGKREKKRIRLALLKVILLTSPL
jgi:hypothetical protein